MPFAEAFSAACGGCVLGDKDRVAFGWCLFSIFWRICGRETFGYKIKGVRFYNGHSFSADIVDIGLG